MGVGGWDADEEGQSVRVRQDVHLGARLAPVHGAWTCVFAPLLALTWAEWSTTRDRSSRPVSSRRCRISSCSQPTPRSATRSRTCGERSTSMSKARRQCPPGAPADQDVDDGRKHRLIRRVLRSTALRPHPRERDQRLCISHSPPEQPNSTYPGP